MDTKEKRNRVIALHLFLFSLSVYLLTASDATVYDTDASHARYEVTKSIVERFDISIPKGLGVRGSDGRDYSWFGLGNSVLAVPFYIVGNYIGKPEDVVSIMNQCIGAAVVVLIFLFCLALGCSVQASILTSIFYGLGTFAWPLTKQPFDHTVETFFVLSSIYLICLYKIKKKIPFLLLSAFSFGVAFLTRITSILLVPSILIILVGIRQTGSGTALRRFAKDMMLFSVVFCVFLCITFWYNYYRFGSIFETGYSLIAAKTGLTFFSGTPLLTGLAGFLASPGKGFFYYSPVAILFLSSIRAFVKRNPALGLSFILLIGSYLLFLSKNVYWHGDWAWGPRYLLVLTPFFIIPISGLFDSEIWRRRNFVRLISYFLFVAGFVIQIAAISVDFQKYFFNLSYEKKIKFNIVLGRGVQTITEPPAAIYFDWHYSPIKTQFTFIREMAGKIGDYRYSEPREEANIYEKLQTTPSYNVFDFWWLYRYFIEGSSSGFIIALMFLLIVIYEAVRLRNLAVRNRD